MFRIYVIYVEFAGLYSIYKLKFAVLKLGNWEGKTLETPAATEKKKKKKHDFTKPCGSPPPQDLLMNVPINTINPPCNYGIFTYMDGCFFDGKCILLTGMIPQGGRMG